MTSSERSSADLAAALPAGRWDVVGRPGSPLDLNPRSGRRSGFCAFRDLLNIAEGEEVF